MKHLVYILLLALIFPFITTSCLDDDDNTQNNPTCMIAGFTLKDIVAAYSTKTRAGKDTTYNRIISGNSILFNIDQIKGEINSIDSLPNWLKVNKVVPNITYSGTLYCRQGDESGDFIYFRSGTDSIDITKDVTFMVVSNDGKYKRNYKVKLYKSVLETDSLYWSQVSGNNLKLKGEHRSLTRGTEIFVFADNNGNPTVTVSSAHSAQLDWSTPQTLSEKINYKSVTLFGTKFYALDAEGYVYYSSDAVNWTKLSDKKMERLLAADKQRIFAYDGSAMLSSTDGTNWDEETADDLDRLPLMPVSYACYTTKTNTNLDNVVMMGNNTAADYAVAWYKISSTNTAANQNWNYINVTDENKYGMPQLENVQMVKYKDMLIAIGGVSADATLDAYSDIYVSEDNGISWHVPEAKMAMVKAWKASPLPMTMVACGEYIWVIQSGGKVWRGIISTD